MASERDIDESKGIVYAFWRHLKDGRWEQLTKILSDEFEAYWPQSDEKITGADAFIKLCQHRPSDLETQVFNCVSEYDRWDKTFSIAVQVAVESLESEGKKSRSFRTSVFEIDRDGLITCITEYMAPTFGSPQWRKGLTEASNANRLQGVNHE